MAAEPPATPQGRRLPDPHDVTPQAVGAYRVAEHLIATRGEVLSTMLIDGIMVVGATWIRAGVLHGIAMVGDPDAHNWVVAAVELIVDVGTVATVLAITAFDLGKRVKLAYEEYQR